MNIKKNIPNAITCGNLLCGCLALIETFNGNLVNAAYLVGIALVLDFFDGFAARMLRVSSAIGKDLDSLADMVTFGAVPGMVMFKMIGISLSNIVVINSGWHTTIYPTQPLAYIALIIPVFSCIRLAKFNNDTRQSESFIGLPTPANAMVICSIPLILEFQKGAVDFIVNSYILCLLSFILSFLLVAELPLFALKFKGFGWSDPKNKLRYIFLGLSIILLLSLKFVAIPLIILLYILISIVNNMFLKKKV